METGEAALTQRQREILILILRGYTNRGIAREIYRSVRTVEGHITRLGKVAGTRGRVGLRSLAARHGITENERVTPL